ncbi:structural maintenance of chromosomes protein 6-like protein [Sarcoptes scabiei]|nr:structural maintenance of chromosomes protein 6-like protein [Sarcoptes scabiei]
MYDPIDVLETTRNESCFDRENFRACLEVSTQNLSSQSIGEFARIEETFVSSPKETSQSQLIPEITLLSSQRNNEINDSPEKNLNALMEIDDDDSVDDVDGNLGYIESITLQNFMCHTNFHLEFGSRINFIIGQNGSGKSAILNGIVLGLGGRASATNRGSGLSSFVKNGETKAKIIIKLSNYAHGQTNQESSYMFERYGKSITIERTIYISGYSSYRIRSESNKVISEKKEELDNILKHFLIYIDNPICVLTQEISKNFLNSKNASDKYKFFVKATQIEDTQNDYEIANSNYENSLQLMQEKTEVYQVLARKLKDLRNQVKIIEKLRNIFEQSKNLKYEKFWAEVKESEKNLNILQSNLFDCEKNLSKCVAKIGEKDEKIKTLDEQKTLLDQKLNNFCSQLEQAQNAIIEAKRTASDGRKRLADTEINLRVIQNDLNLHIKEISALQKRIYGIEKSSQECEEMNIEALIETKTKEMNAIKDEEKELKEKVLYLQQENEEFIKKKIQFNEENRKIEAQVSSYKAEIDRIGRSEQNRLGRYGSKFPELNAQIDLVYRQKKFKHRPFGPIGEYIRLKDDSAALAVECCLKSFLFAYVVDNGDDANVLKSIMNRLFINQKPPTIIIRKYSPLHDVSRTETISERFQNFLQLLNIETVNTPVANCLIDHLRIEQILFIPNFREAQHILLRKESVPKNCNIAYTADGDLMYPSTNRSDYKCYPNKRVKLARILVKDQARTKKHYQTSIETLKTQQLSVCDQLKEVFQKIEENKKSIITLNHQMNKLKMEQLNLENKIQELKSKILIEPIEAQALREEVQKLENERGLLQKQADKIKEERSILSNDYSELEANVDIKNKLYQEMIDSRQPIQNESDRLSEQILLLKQQIDRFQADKSSIEQMKHDLEQSLQTNRGELVRLEQKALEECDNRRIETEKTVKQIDKEINELNSIINDNQSMLDSQLQSEIIGKHHEMKSSCERLESDLRSVRKYYKMFEYSMNQRKKAYLKMRTYMAYIVDYLFKNFLSNKDFIGKIEVNYQKIDDEAQENTIGDSKRKAKTLDIEIKPRHKEFDSQASEINSYSSTKSLSGGERSFSTVAFIISLWNICRSPFKILDEVDVFMDMINRKISLDTMIEYASTKSNKQYIFLSPLQIQQLQHTEDVRIFQMPDPER